MIAILRQHARAPQVAHSGGGANIRGDGGPAGHGGGHGRGENRESCDDRPHPLLSGVGVFAELAFDCRRQSRLIVAACRTELEAWWRWPSTSPPPPACAAKEPAGPYPASRFLCNEARRCRSLASSPGVGALGF